MLYQCCSVTRYISSVKIFTQGQCEHSELVGFYCRLHEKSDKILLVFASRIFFCFSRGGLFHLLNNFQSDINDNLQILYSNDNKRQIINRWINLKIKFGLCTRLDQAGSDWERAACLCLTVKEDPLLLLRKRHDEKKKCLGGDTGKPPFRSHTYSR